MIRDAYSRAGMAALERAYDEVVYYLCGDVMLGEYLREGIAVAILFTADACPDDWEQMAKHAKVKVRDVRRDRACLSRAKKTPPEVDDIALGPF